MRVFVFQGLFIFLLLVIINPERRERKRKKNSFALLEVLGRKNFNKHLIVYQTF